MVNTWDEFEEKEAAMALAPLKHSSDDEDPPQAPPPLPPPLKDEMAQHLKKIVEKKKEAAVSAAPASDSSSSQVQGLSVMDKLGGFRMNPANMGPSSGR